MDDITNKTLLGFDFGLKRIGVAVGQTVTKSARPLVTLHAKQGSPEWSLVDKLIKTWTPQGLVVGVPLNMDGSVQALTHLADHFANLLSERYPLPVYKMDERLSTKEAKARLFSTGGYKALQKGQVDSVAAQLILENWLTSES